MKGAHLTLDDRKIIQRDLENGMNRAPSSVEVLGNFRRLHFFLALMSHTTCPAILDFSTKILCPFWAFFY